MALAGEEEFRDAVAVALDGDVEGHVAVAQPLERPAVVELLGDERLERQPVGLGGDAEEHLHRQREVARERPQHVGRIEFGGDVAVVEVEVLLVGGEEGRRTEHRPQAEHHAARICRLGVGQRPVRGHERPEGVVVV